MGLRRNIEFQTQEIYKEIQRLSNLYANGNNSRFIRMIAMSYEENRVQVIDLEQDVRDLNKQIAQLEKLLEERS